MNEDYDIYTTQEILDALKEIIRFNLDKEKFLNRKWYMVPESG